jgi:hypothetical protein
MRKTQRHSSSGLEALERRQLFSTYTVTTTADSGSGSLREAVLRANGTAEADVIRFKLAGSDRVIKLQSAIDPVVSPLTIDGATQPGYAGKPLVAIDGGNKGFSLLSIMAPRSTVNGLALYGSGNSNFDARKPAVAFLHGATDGTFSDNYVGLKTDGTTARTNHGFGVNMTQTGGDVRGNVIASSRDAGLYITADNVTVQSNFIGTDASGQSARPNRGGGIRVENTHGVKIGGPDLGNVIAGNGGFGVRDNLTNFETMIEGNRIGLTADGKHVLKNGVGVWIEGSDSNVHANYFGAEGVYNVGPASIHSHSKDLEIGNNSFGLTADGLKLPVADLSGTAVTLVGSESAFVHNNTIANMNTAVRILRGGHHLLRGNHIGLRENSTAIGWGNTYSIEISDSNRNNIEWMNRIGYSGHAGVHIASGQFNKIYNNEFVNNQGLDVDLGKEGITPNDKHDLDEGANGLLNTFVIEKAVSTGKKITIAGTLDVNTQDDYQGTMVTFYASPLKHADGTGDGRTVINTINFEPGKSSAYAFEFAGAVPDGWYVSALTTQSIGGWATSEMSMATKLQGPPQITAKKWNAKDRSISYSFSQDVSKSLGVLDLLIRHTGNGMSFRPSRVDWNAKTNTATFFFGGALFSGSYRAEFYNAGVTNAAGNAVMGDGSLSLFI